MKKTSQARNEWVLIDVDDQHFTLAMPLPGVGCLVEAKQWSSKGPSISVAFCPGVQVSKNEDGSYCLT
jgi:hypothetical protein